MPFLPVVNDTRGLLIYLGSPPKHGLSMLNDGNGEERRLGERKSSDKETGVIVVVSCTRQG